jgi:GNAT superfamily N-acetyltransferase
VTAAVSDGTVVGLVTSILDADRSVRRLLAVGVAPAWRRQGLATALLRSHVAVVDGFAEGVPLEALVTAAERDPVEPLAREARVEIARRLLGGAGFAVKLDPGAVGRADRLALHGVRPVARTSSRPPA